MQQAMFKRRFKDLPGGLENHEMIDVKHTVTSLEVKNNFGTCIAAVCFCSYIFPVLSPGPTEGNTYLICKL